MTNGLDTDNGIRGLFSDLRLRGVTSSTVLLLALSLGACTATTYNIDFHEGAFRVADELTVDPGQAGDDGSNTASGSTAGGADGAPGGSNLVRGFAQQGNIFQIGTSQRPETTTRASATVQSPNSQTGTGEAVTNSAPPAPVD